MGLPPSHPWCFPTPDLPDASVWGFRVCTQENNLVGLYTMGKPSSVKKSLAFWSWLFPPTEESPNHKIRRSMYQITRFIPKSWCSQINVIPYMDTNLFPQDSIWIVRFGNPRILTTIGKQPSGPHIAFNHSKDGLNCLVRPLAYV